MIQQQFVLNDGSKPALFVVRQQSYKYDAMAIQISEVLDMNNIHHNEHHSIIHHCYIYEEINHDDMVQYATYMSIDQINKYYKWFN